MIRLFTNKDSESCRRIIEMCFDYSVILEEKAKAHVRKTYTKDGYFESKAVLYPLFVYEKNRNVVALGGIEGNVIKKLYVAPEEQGKGIGTEMLVHLESIGIEAGHKEFVLYCFENSVGFYKNRGYSIVGPYFFKGDRIEVPTIEMRKRV
jgi:citrate lyase synthetase